MLLKRGVFGWVLVFLFSAINAIGQEELDEACLAPNKKAAKSLENARKASSLQAKVDFFLRAIAEDEENATPYYEYATYAFQQGSDYYQIGNTVNGDKGYATAEQMYVKVLERCKEYHAEVYYNLGLINYAQKDQASSAEYFRQFLNFQSEDLNRMPVGMPKMKKDVEELLKKWESQEAVTSNQVPFAPFRVPNVNTPNDEYFPMLSPDNELMFYTRKLDRRNLGDMVGNVVEEFTFSQRKNIKSEFDGGTPFKRPFNDGSFKNYGAATLSVDNKEMIICACQETQYQGRDYLNCDLYVTQYTRTGAGGNDFNWTPLKNLGPNINTPDGWEGQPSLSADGKTLYFTTTRSNTRDNDIYISERQANGEWSKAVPFKEVNTAGKDKSPFIHPDNETFYFVSTSSEERPGAGGLDIFYLRKKADGSWGEPQNIGVPINTPQDELGLFVSSEGSLAYYSSRAEGNFGIYGFELYLEARPESVVIVKGDITDENGDPVKDAEVEVSYSDGTSQSFQVNGDDGKYAAVVKTAVPGDVALQVKQEGRAFSSTLITQKELTETRKKGELSITAKNLESKILQPGEEYEIADIRYATNSAALSASSKLVLKQFARYLIQNPGLNVEIGGHTDDVGEDFANLLLSEERAKGVRDFLISQGVNKNRLTAKGYGETQPRVLNDSEENRAKNRRTVFRILPN